MLIILKPAISILKTFLISDRNSCVRKEGEKLEELYLTAREWKVVKKLVKLLSPFENVTCLLSDAAYPTISLTYLSMCNLKEKLETKFINMETEMVDNCRKVILEDLQERWEFSQDLCLKGLFFDPCFKSLDFVSHEVCNDIINQLQTEYQIFKDDLIPNVSSKSNEDQDNQDN